MFALELCEGPACPRCGCPDVDILRQPVHPIDIDPDGSAIWYTSGRASCRHCRTTFSFQELPSLQTQPPPPLQTRWS